ncbi:unnamed protein product [Sphagnum balticum]
MEEKKKKKLEKKNSRQGISAEVFGQFNKKTDFAPKVIEKDEKTREIINKLIEKSILFQSLQKEDIAIVINAMQVVKTSSQQPVITEGEKGDTLYIIGEGDYDCHKIINDIDPYEKEQLCDTLKEEEFAAGSYIVRQGDQGDKFYIIAEGKLAAEKQEGGAGQPKKVFEYSEGDYFG